RVRGPGQAAISVWYLSRVAAARVASPYPNAVDPAAFRNALRNNFIDGLVLRKLDELALEPSASSSDSEFIRRAYLDPAGYSPHRRRGPAVSERSLTGQAPASDRRAPGAAGVHRLLGLQMVRPAARLEQKASAERDVVLLRLDSLERGSEQALELDDSRAHH